MVKILCTSAGFYTDTIKQHFLNLLEKAPSQLKAAIITTASRHKANNKYAIKAQQDFLELGFNDPVFIDVENEHPSRLRNYQVIYICGGNPYHLLYHLKKSGVRKALKEADNIVGVSAGAIVLGPHLKLVDTFTPEMNLIGLNELSGLQLTNEIIFPHYDREELFPDPVGKTIEERLIAFEIENQCSVIRLKDDECYVTRK